MFKKVASLVIVPLLLMLWSRLGSQTLTLYSFNALSNYPSPYTAPIATGNSGEGVSSQVVIVIVDALRADISRAMPTLNTLRAKGADRTLQVGLPSISLPGWTVIGTGAWQEQTGITLNFYTDTIKVETIFEAAKRKGLTTAIVGEDHYWKQLYSRGIDFIDYGVDPANPYEHLDLVRLQDDDVEAKALKILTEKKPNLMLIHFVEVDDAGHGKGGTSAEYKNAALAIDTRIARIVSALDLTQATVIVTADHGQIDPGGHGGNEPVVMTVPLVAAGKAIKPGQYASATQADIAPTLATLLGTSIPAHSQGQPLFDEIDLPPSLRAQRAVDTAQEISNRYAQIANVIGASPFDHKKLDEAKQALATNPDAAYQAALADIQSTRMQATSAKDARLMSERLARLPIGLLILVPFTIYLFIIYRAKWDWRAPIIGLLVYNLVYNGLFFGRGLSWSLSNINNAEQIVAFFTARTIDAMIALLIATIIVGIACRKQGKYQTALAIINMAFLVAAVLAVQIDFFYVLWNVSFNWYLPDLTLGFKYYLDVLQTGAFWPLVYVPLLAILPFIALGARWIAAKIPVSK